MRTHRRPRRDCAHHHPVIHKVHDHWAWTCTCGSASRRTVDARLTWHGAVVGALLHATEIAA
jgi:hypothetical protein